MDEHSRRVAPPKASSSPSEADRQLPHLVRPNDRAIRSHSSGLSWFRMSFVRVLSQNAIANWFETGPGNEVQGAGEASKSTFKRTVSMSASQNPARLRPSAGRTRAQCLGLRTRPRRRVELPPMLKAEQISGNQPPRRSCPAGGGVADFR